MKDPAVTKAAQDLKSELEASAQALRKLGEEVRLQLHLGSLDIKDEWKRLEPRLESTLERAAKDVTEASRTALTEVTAAVRRLRHSLG